MKRTSLVGAVDSHKMTPWSTSILQGQLLSVTMLTAHPAACREMRHEIGVRGVILLDELVAALSMSMHSQNLVTMRGCRVLTQQTIAQLDGSGIGRLRAPTEERDPWTGSLQEGLLIRSGSNQASLVRLHAARNTTTVRHMKIKTTAGLIPYNQSVPTFRQGPVGADVAPGGVTLAMLAMAPFLLAQTVDMARRIHNDHRPPRDSLQQGPLDATVDVVDTSLPRDLQRQGRPARCTQSG